MSNQLLRKLFGAWLITKNVVDALMGSSSFKSWAVYRGRSRSGIAEQFHIYASGDKKLNLDTLRQPDIIFEGRGHGLPVNRFCFV